MYNFTTSEEFMNEIALFTNTHFVNIDDDETSD